MMSAIIPYIPVGLLSGVIGIALYLGKSRLDGIEKSVANIEKSMEKRLYDSQGLTIFMSREECQKTHSHLCLKLEEVKTMVKESDKETRRLLEAMDRKRDQSKEQLLVSYGEIQKSIGRIEGQLKKEVSQ